MIFYTICFSLGDASKNRYVEMLYLLYESLCRTGTFTKGKDTFYVITDSDTAKHIPSTHFSVVYIPKVKNLMEGMALKYQLHKLVSIKMQTVVYMDVDILSIRRHTFPELFPDQIAVFPEGNPQNNCYRGDDMPVLVKRYGVTAGFFMYNMGPYVERLFDILADICKTTDLKFYALDQPFFNRFLPDSAVYLDPRLISFNGNSNKATACFVNCAGEPGNAELHVQKMRHFFMEAFNRNGGRAS